jgi:hypothetical protein
VNVSGQPVLTDEEDSVLLTAYRWHLSRKSHTSYVIRRIRTPKGRKTVYLHREITKAPAGLVVDHINGNGLDNRRENLRVVTAQENAWNQRVRADSRTGLTNVSHDAYSGTYRVHFQMRSLEEALIAAKAAQSALAVYRASLKSESTRSE